MRALSESAGGKNAYSFDCDPTNTRATYAICLNLLGAIVKKRIDGGFADCRECISAKTCPALSMRKREVIEKQALYFKEYGATNVPARPRKQSEKVARVNTSCDSYRRGRYGPSITGKSQSVLTKKKEQDFIQMNPEQIVNDLSLDSERPQPGESPKDYAIRLKKQRSKA